MDILKRDYSISTSGSIKFHQKFDSLNKTKPVARNLFFSRTIEPHKFNVLFNQEQKIQSQLNRKHKSRFADSTNTNQHKPHGDFYCISRQRIKTQTSQFQKLFENTNATRSRKFYLLPTYNVSTPTKFTLEETMITA